MKKSLEGMSMLFLKFSKRLTMMMTLLLVATLGSAPLWAQQVEVQDNGATPVGRARAAKYFQERRPVYRSPSAVSPGSAPRYLSLQIGTFFDDQSYDWGKGTQSDRGQLNIGVSYRMGEWVNSMDFLLRAELSTYHLHEGSARQLSFVGMITFPDAGSRFPLYFGLGLGPGVFIKQIHDESALALDYELVAGARFFNVIDTMGFSLELGMKNHIHLLSDGQYNGLFISAGTVFTF